MAIFRDNVKIPVRQLAISLRRIEKTRLKSMLKSMYQSTLADGLKPEEVDDHDNMYEPRTKYEIILWEGFRETAKNDVKNTIKNIKNGNLGGRKKNITEEEKSI